MSKKYLFFDIDGTLTDSNPGGKILDSTFRTLDKLRQNGHFVAIATGRAQWMAKEFAQLSKIDNLVTDGGNGITLNGKVKYIKPLDSNKAVTLIDECINKQLPYAVVLDNSPVLYSNTSSVLNCQIHGQLKYDPELDFHHVKEIFKIFIYLSEKQEKQLEHLNGLDHMRYFGEHLIVEPTDKYQGILDMIEMIGGNKEDIVVFGDGHNDYSMIKQAPISIAMGNAKDELKEIATFVTKRNDDDGIEYACKHFGWID